MHDIGKIGCVLNLNKPGKLSQRRVRDLQEASGLRARHPRPHQILAPLIPGVHLHHERWDGRGYPLGLEGKRIPIMARIIAVADTYDAMTSDRAYRRALPHEIATTEIERCANSQFDPDVAGEFNDGLDGFREERRDRGEQVPE